MRRALLLLLLCACVQQRSVSVTFGTNGEGLDGFLCKRFDGGYVLAQDGADAGTQPASLVVDFVRLSGLPACRLSQLIEWCSSHACTVMETTRTCTPIELPAVPMGDREMVRARVQEQLSTLSGKQISGDAPDEGVMLRVVATRERCDAVMNVSMAFDPKQLVGCAYSCPTQFDQIDQDVYLGFDTPTAFCEQGLRTCSDRELHWQP